MILKVVDCEKLCMREHITVMGAWGLSPQPLGNFSENSHFKAIQMTFCTFLKQLEKAKLLRFGRVWRNLFCSIKSGPAHLLIKSKICSNAERLRICLKGGQSSRQFRWFTISKIELYFLIFFALTLGLRLQRYSANRKRYSLKKVFGNSEVCSSRQNHRRPNSLENCGFGEKNKSLSFKNFFRGESFFICWISSQSQSQT